MIIDFSNIRSYERSQNNGFEELVCQLAHLQKPEGAKAFIRKEGAGGDAGVECYWIQEDSSEIGWQAKFFIGGMDDSRWNQLDKSFKTALEKHPNLKKYIVSFPLNRTDSRKKGRGGKLVVSVQDEWDKKVKSWMELANKKKRSIEFEFWGKHELTLFLTIDDPLYSGRALYWFNEPILGFETFEAITQKSRESLDERYTPEFHVDLPIAESFDALSSNPDWWERVAEERKKLIEQNDQFFRSFLGKKHECLHNEFIEQLEKNCSELMGLLFQSMKCKDLIGSLNEIKSLSNQIQDHREKLIKQDKKDQFYESEFKNEYYIFDSFFYAYQRFEDFLDSRSVKAAETGAALLYGEAGIGKSHLLCDMSLHRIDHKLPTIFLLGQHYEGGNPVQTLKNALDLSNFSNKQVLGALDAVGEASKTRTLIIIDAINEGLNRDDWHNHIRAFLSETSKYKNISILLSCRTTYLNYILPDSVNDDCLIRIRHNGFQGYEHRAAEKYMSKQGISKPSAPILAPEFTNPLFLKTCCQALRDSGYRSFPKGLRGLSSLFDFYMQSVENAIAKKKRYTPAEKIVRNSLVEFASKIIPNNFDGLPKSEARAFINTVDPNPNIGCSLFDELLDESVITEDISYDKQGNGKPVIRFTYERFSDHIVSLQIVSQYDETNINEIFSNESLLGKIIKDNGYYRFEGVFNALSIILAEKFNIELIDVLPDDCVNSINNWVLERIFSETITWRSPTSFTDRSLELLNSLNHNEYESPAFDILLKLSTEPEHPWNANLIHKNLIDKSMAERDRFWSIRIALGDQIEEDGEPESIIRTLIEWSFHGEINDIEEERARLCAITLFWFLTTSNRKVRDQATKSLVRLLSFHPNLLPALINKFHFVNDLYLVERLYAVVYGVVCNINDKSLISETAKIVYDLIFKDGEPVPHILLRDYARGILEYALHQELIPDHITPDHFRPPYKSDWPIENPTKEEIDKFADDDIPSRIKSSVMTEYLGDFGKYTMSCIHEWSATPLSEPAPKSGYEYKKEFAENFLSGAVKNQFLEKIKPKKSIYTDFSNISIEFVSTADATYKKEREQKEAFNEKIVKNLNEEEKEYFRWLSGLSNHRPAAFSRKWAQRWVCKRAHELGWKKELFENFEKRCSYGRGSGPGNDYMERIGKKYQWIALHELLARLSDNVYWIDRGYSDIEDKKYYGPWQMHKRNIDPTIWIRSNAEGHAFYNKETTWWQSYKFPLEDINNLDDQIEFMWSEQTIPDFQKIIKISAPQKVENWLVLNGFWMQKQEDESEKNPPRLDAWFRINSIVIKKGDFEKVRKTIDTKNLIDPHTVNVPSTQHQGFLGEYPWHPSCRFMTGWVERDEGWEPLIPTNYFVPVSRYEWESGSVDHSLDSSLDFYMPAADLVTDMKLLRSKRNFGAWINGQGETIFLDPSIAENGPSFALIKKDVFCEWLEKNGFEILWLIGGEKQLFQSYSDTFYGRLVYNALYRLEKGKLVGSIWFNKEKR